MNVDPVAHRRVPGELDDLADHLLAEVVGRVGLAGEDELDRPLGVEQQGLAAARAGTAAAWPACRRRTGGQSRWSGAWGRGPRRPRRRRWGKRPSRAGTTSAAARTKPTRASLPCSRARHSSSSRASSIRAQSAGPASSHAGLTYLVNRSFIGRGDPRAAVHAVGDRADRHLVRGHRRPQRLEHQPAGPAVQLGHAVGHAGQAQAHDGHVERGVGGSPGRGRGTSGRRWRRRTRRAQPAKYLSISSPGKRSMPAGTGVWVVKTVPARAASTASAKRRPSAVISWRIRSRPRNPAWPSLVWKTWARSPSGLEGPHPADAEQDLLAEPVLGPAAVEPVGDCRAGRRRCRRRRRRAGTA